MGEARGADVGSKRRRLRHLPPAPTSTRGDAMRRELQLEIMARARVGRDGKPGEWRRVVEFVFRTHSAADVVTEALHMEHGDRYQFTVRSL